MTNNKRQVYKFAENFCLDRIANAVKSFVFENLDRLESDSCYVKLLQDVKLEDYGIEFVTNVKTYGDLPPKLGPKIKLENDTYDRGIISRFRLSCIIAFFE